MRFASALAQTWKDYGPDREEVDALRCQGAMQRFAALSLADITGSQPT